MLGTIPNDAISGGSVGVGVVGTPGTTVVTATFTNSVQPNYHGLYIAEYSGVNTAHPVDTSAAQGQETPTTATDAVTSTAGTSLYDNETVVGSVWSLQNFTTLFTVGTGFTQREYTHTGVSPIGMGEEKVFASQGGVAATFTSSSALDDTITFMVVLRNTVDTPYVAKTWYVRPADDGNGTTFTYGSGDGTSLANAFVGFAAVTGIRAGDTVCLPGGDEPFFEQLPATTVSGMASRPVIWKGCGSTQAIIWSAQGLSGNRSFDSSGALITTSPYAWTTLTSDLGGNVYRKKIDKRGRMLWEDSTWLQPVNIDASSEATVLATLPAGSWGMRNNGGSTFWLYYHPTTPAKDPTNTIIRTHHIPYDGVKVGIISVNKPYQTFQNIEVRGATAAAQTRSMYIIDAPNLTLDTMLFYRNVEGPFIYPLTIPMPGVLINDVSVQYSEGTGLYITPGLGLNDFHVIGGHYDHTTSLIYNGTNFSAGDGDGIGFGQNGGLASDVVIKNVTANYNFNAGIFFGTTFSMTVTNVSISGVTMKGNARNCYYEGSTNQIVGTFTMSGFLCQDTGTGIAGSSASMKFEYAPASLRTTTITNGVFSGNANNTRILFNPHANNKYSFQNLVFVANPGEVATDRGDLNSNGRTLIGTEEVSNIYFYSLQNLNRVFARLSGGTTYKYNVGGDLAAFNASINATGTAVNTDPLLISSTDFRPQPTSPLIDSGTTAATSTDYAGNPIYGTPDIGAYEYQPPYTFSSNSIPTTGSSRLYSDGKYRMTAASSTSALASFSVAPVGGVYTASTSQYMDITLTSWQTTGDKNKQWIATSTTSAFDTHATSTVYTIGDLDPSSYYIFKVDSTASTTALTDNSQCTAGVCLSDSSGNLTFTYTGGYSTHTFDLTKDAFALASPSDNAQTSESGIISLSWTASTKPNLSYYQLYIDGSLTTDNIASSALSVSAPSSLSCNQSHSWYMKAIDTAGNATNSDTRHFTRPCGPSSSGPRAMPSVVPTPTPTPPTTATTTTPTAPPKSSGLSESQIQAILSLLNSFGNIDQSIIASVALSLQGSPGTPSQSAPQPQSFSFTRNLSLYQTHEEVRQLQQYLNAHGFLIAPSGPGSPNNETTLFGLKTYTALVKFQKSRGLPATGWFGPMTRGRIGAF